MWFKCGHLLVAALVALCWLTHSTEGKQNLSPRQRVAEDPGCTTVRVDGRRAHVCLSLATCHMALGDISRKRSQPYAQHYDQARRSIGKFYKYVSCGIRRVYEKCQEQLPKCWLTVKRLAINGLTGKDVGFMNRCSGSAFPFMFNLCIGKVKGHWPSDIYDDLQTHLPSHCSQTCSLFKQFQRYHLDEGVKYFPEGWTEGTSVALEEQDERKWANGIIDSAIQGGFTKMGGTKRVRTPKPSPPQECQQYLDCKSNVCTRGVNCRKGPIIVASLCTVCSNCTATVCRVCTCKMFTDDCNYYGVCPKPKTTTPAPEACQRYEECNGGSCTRGVNCIAGPSIVASACTSCSECAGTVCRKCICKMFTDDCGFYNNCPCTILGNCTTITTPAPAVAEKASKEMALEDEIQNCKNDTECLRKFVRIPWIVTIQVTARSKKFSTAETMQIEMQISSCRMDSWVGYVYTDFPHSILGLCYREGRVVGTDVHQNYIRFVSVTSLRANATGAIFDCGDSYIVGAKLKFKEIPGSFTYVESAEWRCGGTDIDTAPNENSEDELYCPHLTLLCAITTTVMKDKSDNQFKIINIKFGCCDVAQKTMYYNATNVVNQPAEQYALDGWNGDQQEGTNTSRDRTAYLKWPTFAQDNPDGCYHFINTRDYKACLAYTKLCPPGQHITGLGVELLSSYAVNPLKSAEYHLMKTDFLCSDHIVKNSPSTSLSQELYSDLSTSETTKMMSSNYSVTCPPNYYAYGVESESGLVTADRYGSPRETKLHHINTFKLICSDNYIENIMNVSIHAPGGLSNYENKNNHTFRCPKKYAICGLNAYPTDHLAPGYDFKFKCCPIPVRHVVARDCPAGVQFRFDRDKDKEEGCIGLDCEIGDVTGILKESVALPTYASLRDAHYPGFLQDQRMALFTSSNPTHGVDYSMYFGRNNRSTYVGIGEQLSRHVLELHPETTNTLNALAEGAEVVAAFATSASGGTLAGVGGIAADGLKFAAIIGGFFEAKEDANKALREDLPKINMGIERLADQFYALQDEVRMSRLFTQIQTINVVLRFTSTSPNITFFSAVPRVFREKMQCGDKWEYDFARTKFYYLIPSSKCTGPNRPKESFEELHNGTLDNTNGTTEKKFTVRFNRVGTVIDKIPFTNVDAEVLDPDSISHFMKWETLIENVAEDGFKSSAPMYGTTYADLPYLFKRPNNTKFYFADIPIPAGMVGQASRRVATCRSWKLYTKFVHYKITTKPIGKQIDWKTVLFKDAILEARE